MRLARPLVALVLTLILVREAGAATIDYPQTLTFGGETVYQVWDEGTEFEPIIVDATWTCTVYDASSVQVVVMDDSTAPTWTVDATGFDASGPWELDCGTTSAEFVVGDDADTLAWFPYGDAPGALVGLAQEYDGWFEGTDAWGFTDQWYDDATAPAIADAGTTVPLDWAVRDGWWYVLNVALPTAWDGGPDVDCDGVGGITSGEVEAVPKQSDLGTRCSTTAGVDTPAALIASDGAYAAAHTMEKLALAFLVADEYADEALTGDANLAGLRDTYEQAALAWGDEVIAGQVFSSTDGFDDLDHARLLMSSAVVYDWMHPHLDAERRYLWMAALVENTDWYYKNNNVVNGGSELRSSDTDHYSNKDWTAQRRLLRNGHFHEPYAGLGAAMWVLEDEMAPGASTTWFAWNNDTVTAIGDVFMQLGVDGADHAGVSQYGEQSLDALVRYLDVERSFDPVSWLPPPWLANAPRFYRHLTAPDGSRVPIGDGMARDVNGPSSQLAAISAWTTGSVASLARRQAWLGHVEDSYSSGKTRRDVLDILRTDTSAAPMTDTDANFQPPRACFNGTGITSFRSGWDAGAAHLVYMGGRVLGGHDDMASGAFWYHYGGDKVVTDGDNQISKRTMLHSTLLIDNNGQHGDGQHEAVAVPHTTSPPTERNAVPMGWSDDTCVDVELTWTGTDLTNLYLLGSEANVPGGVDVDSTGKGPVHKLQRHVIWLGGPTVMYDVFETTPNSPSNLYEFTWLLNGPAFGSMGSTPTTCSLGPAPYPWIDDTPTAYDVTLSGGANTWTSGGPPSSWTREELNSGDYFPDVSGCTPAIVSGVKLAGTPNTVATLYDEDPAVGSSAFRRVAVVALENGADVFGDDDDDLRPVPYLDGGTVGAFQVRRSLAPQSGDGAFITALIPYDESVQLDVDGKPDAMLNTAYEPDGTRVDVALTAADVHLYFDTPGDGAVYTTTAGDQLNGTFGVLANSASGNLAAQLVSGSMLKVAGTTILSSSSVVSLGVTWRFSPANDVIGTVTQLPGSGATVRVWVGSRPIVSGVLVEPNGTTHILTVTPVSPSWVDVVIPKRGTLYLTPASVPTGPYPMPATTCF